MINPNSRSLKWITEAAQKQIKRWCITAALQIKKKFHNVGCKGSIIRANLQILPDLFCFIT